jgi:hypothetical protein
MIAKLMRMTDKNYDDDAFNQGYVAALDKIAEIICRLETQPGRTIPELKAFKDVLKPIFYLKIDKAKIILREDDIPEVDSV